MNVSIERIENSQVVITLAADKDVVAKAFDSAFKKIAGQVNIPGFRKGKAPRKIIENRIGKEVLREEALDIFNQQGYNTAMKNEQLFPVGAPSVDVVTFDEGQDAVVKITTTVKPEVTLGQYKDLGIEKEEPVVTEEILNQAIEDLRTTYAKMMFLPEDAAAENGDYTLIDFAGTIDGVPFGGGEGKGYPLEIGSGSFIPGFETQLLGVKAGETRTVTVSFPADYHVETLANKEAKFEVKVQDIKRKNLPAVDDVLAEEAGYENLEALKEDTKEKLLESLKTKANQDFITKCLDTVTDNAQVEIPKIMVDDKIDNIIAGFAYDLEQRGMTIDLYLERMGKALSELKEMYRENAAAQVKSELVLEAIAKAEKIEVTERDVMIEFYRLADEHNAKVKDIQKTIVSQGNYGVFINNLLRSKALAKVVGHDIEPQVEENAIAE